MLWYLSFDEEIDGPEIEARVKAHRAEKLELKLFEDGKQEYA